MLLDLPGLLGINIILYWLVWIFRANKQRNIYHYHFTIKKSAADFKSYLSLFLYSKCRKLDFYTVCC